MSYFSARNFFSFKKQASFLKYFLVYMISFLQKKSAVENVTQ